MSSVDLPKITDVVLDQWEASADKDRAAGRQWSVNPVAVLAVVAEVRRLREIHDDERCALDAADESAAEAEKWKAHAREMERQRNTFGEALTRAANGEPASEVAQEAMRRLLDETYRPEGGEIVMRELGKVRGERDAAVAEVGRVREALQAARDLHVEVARRPGPDGTACAQCDHFWPCATVRALDAALDGAE